MLQGPNSNRQTIELYSDDGRSKPIFYTLEMPGYGSTVQVWAHRHRHPHHLHHLHHLHLHHLLHLHNHILHHPPPPSPPPPSPPLPHHHDHRLRLHLQITNKGPIEYPMTASVGPNAIRGLDVPEEYGLEGAPR